MRRPHLHATPSQTILALYAALLLVAALAFPWWRMECRSPQYGQRKLVISVSPTSVRGDVKEIDGLGHYVGMLPMDTLGQLERAAAPFLVAAAALAALAAPFQRRRWLRGILAGVVIVVPLGFVADLWYWQRYAVNNLDPHAALSMIGDRVQSRLVGHYSVAQFHVDASFQTGFFLVVVAALNLVGFLLADFFERRRRAAAGLAAVLALAVLVCWPARAQAARIEVDAAHPTIAAALAAAAPGDEVVVPAGVYHEHLVIERPLTLRARTGAEVVIDGGGSGTVLQVLAGPTVVRGLTVRGSGISLLGEDAGIRVDGAPGSLIQHNRVDDTLFGIVLLSSPGSRVLGNRVRGKDIEIPRRGDGVRLYDSGASTVEDNVIVHSRDFAIWQSHGVVSRRNHVSDSRYGLHYMYCDDNLFEDNVFADNQVGGAIMYSRRLTLRGNRFTGSRGPSAYGLLIKVGDDVVAEDNWFVDNTRGIFLEDSPSSLYAAVAIHRNVIAGNDVGVSYQASVSRVVFSDNVFAQNRVQAELLGRASGAVNVWSLNGRGNYWSDHVGYDHDDDGISDSPYVLEQFFEHLVVRYPAVGLLRLSPAAEALEMASRAFPVVKPTPTVFDPHPLMEPPRIPGAPPARGASAPLMLAGACTLMAALVVLRLTRRWSLEGSS